MKRRHGIPVTPLRRSSHCFVDDAPHGDVGGLPVCDLASATERFPDARAELGSGDPATREHIADAFRAHA